MTREPLPDTGPPTRTTDLRMAGEWPARHDLADTHPTPPLASRLAVRRRARLATYVILAALIIVSALAATSAYAAVIASVGLDAGEALRIAGGSGGRCGGAGLAMTATRPRGPGFPGVLSARGHTHARKRLCRACREHTPQPPVTGSSRFYHP
ncbi:hypothetical protein ACFV0L_27925 [Streptosporangium canum]|uniref:hypothetical protein n=1 Tax=Streptosporangium canum TaxID=324952 RepID=UPI0036B4FBE4